MQPNPHKNFQILKESQEMFGHCLEQINTQNFNESNFEQSMIECAQNYIDSTQNAFDRVWLPNNKYRAERFPKFEVQKYFQQRKTAFINLGRLNNQTGTYLLFLPFAWGTILSTKNFIDPVYLVGVLFVHEHQVVLLMIFGIKILINKFKEQKIDLQQRINQLVQKLLYMLGFFLDLVVFNKEAIALSISLGFLGAFYPLAKRYTYYPQFILGMAMNSGLLIANAQFTSMIQYQILPFYFGAIFWTMLYDTIYAFQDIDDDKKVGVKSLAILIEKQSQKHLQDFNTIMNLSFFIGGMLMNGSIFYYPVLFSYYFYIRQLINKIDVSDKKQCNQFFQKSKKLGLGYMFVFAFL